MQCFYTAFTNRLSSQTSCINTSLLPYAHHVASYSGYANIISKLQDLLVKMNYEIFISNKKKKHILLERFMRGWHLSRVNACKHVPLTPNLVSQALTQSQDLHQAQVPKASSSFPKQRPLKPITVLLRSRVLAFLLLLHEKLELSYPPASDISAPHTYCLRSQNLIFF